MMTGILWGLITVASAQDEAEARDTAAGPPPPTLTGEVIRATSWEEVAEASGAASPSYHVLAPPEEPSLWVQFLDALGLGQEVSAMGEGGECKCSVTLNADFLEAWADPSVPDNVPANLVVAIPCGPTVTLAQDDRLTSSVAGVTWLGAVVGRPMLRASITRLGGTYSATLHTEEGVWLLHGAPGEPSTAWCVPDENEVESDVEAAQTTLVEVGPDDGTCGNGDVPVIDVLAVYTDAARVAAGGSATNPNDNVDARTDIANSLANVQDALASSLVDARLRVVGIYQIPDEPSGPSCTARSALVTASRTSGTVLKGLVDTLQPDVVMGYMPSYSGADTGCSPTTNWKVLSTGWIESEPDATADDPTHLPHNSWPLRGGADDLAA